MKNAICWQQNLYVIIFIKNLSRGYLNIKQRTVRDCFVSRVVLCFLIIINYISSGIKKRFLTKYEREQTDNFYCRFAPVVFHFKQTSVNFI